MTDTTLRTTEDTISGILNWVCPECGGPMGGSTKEFQRRGKCRRDWRRVWEDSLAAKPASFIRTPVHAVPVLTHFRPTPEAANLSPAADRHSLRSPHHSRRVMPSAANRRLGFSDSRIKGRD
jgi:hypothetical protein